MKSSYDIRIEVIGLGYVGLPLYIILKTKGFQVSGVDIDNHKLTSLLERKFKLDDPFLDRFMENEANLQLSNSNSKADFYFIAVPTPIDSLSKKPILDYLFNAIENIKDFVTDSSIVIIESTIPPGTSELLYEKLPNLTKGHIVHCPERILPGNIYSELVNNDRIIGADNELVSNKVLNIYNSFVKGKIITTDLRTAELSKVIENAYRDVNIAFANEVLLIARDNSVDPYKLIRIANMHPRVNILDPGPGVGGHCIPVDPWFLVNENNNAKLILTARTINDEMPSKVYSRILEILETRSFAIKTIGLYGMTYKADVRDFRESPSYVIYGFLKKLTNFKTIIYDPFFDSIEINTFDNFCDNSDLIVVLVDHQHIKLNINKIENKLIFDAKNCINLKDTFKL
jgi:UDP-N-acetyl-D-mannosaminuronic acid dehydrogenase